jgi:uncharacterized protein (PEP-CTERM system associated)
MVMGLNSRINRDSFASQGNGAGCRRRLKQLKNGTCVALLAALTTGSAAWAGVWHLQPHMEVMETYTDNVDLQPINKKDDFVTRLSPGAHLIGAGAKIKLDVDYTANYLYFAKSGQKSDWRHDLSGKLSSELVDELLFLDAGASIDQQFVDPGAAISANYDNQTNNRKTVQSYLVSPSLRHAFGTFGTATARYSFSYVRTNADRNQVLYNGLGVLQNSINNDWSLGFESGRQFPRLQWGVSADYQLRDRQNNGSAFKQKTVRAHAAYPVTYWLSLVGSVGYEKIDDQGLTRRPNGFIWDAGVTLKPGPRTTLSVRGGRRYDDTNFSVDGQYLFSPRTRMTVAYHDIITTSGGVLAQQLGDSIQFPPNGQTGGSTSIGNLPGNQNGFGLVNNSFRQKRAEIGVSGSRGRNSLGLTGYYETRDINATSGEREKNWGGSGSVSRAVGPHMSAFVSGDYRRAEFSQQLDRIDHIYTADAGLSYALSRDLSGSMSYIMTRRDSNQAQFNLRENAVRISLRATF